MGALMENGDFPTRSDQGSHRSRSKSRHVERSRPARSSNSLRAARGACDEVAVTERTKSDMGSPRGNLVTFKYVKTEPKRTKMPSRTCFRGLRKHITAQHDASQVRSKPNPNVPRCLHGLASVDCVNTIRLSMTQAKCAQNRTQTYQDAFADLLPWTA